MSVTIKRLRNLSWHGSLGSVISWHGSLGSVAGLQGCCSLAVTVLFADTSGLIEALRLWVFLRLFQNGGICE